MKASPHRDSNLNDEKSLRKRRSLANRIVRRPSLTNSNDKIVADVALVQLAELLVSLGRTLDMGKLLEQNPSPSLDAGPLQQRFNKTLEDYSKQVNNPGLSSRCGPMALFQVARVLNPEQTAYHSLVEMKGPPGGCSLALLQQTAVNLKIGVVAVARAAGAPLVVPSVVHWKVGHYGAIVAQEGELFKIVDSAQGRDKLVPASAILAESSGYFLVPQTSITNGFRIVSPEEAEAVVGSGYVTTITDEADHYAPTQQGPGLPVWRVSEPFVSLWLQGTTLRYATSPGKTIVFDVAYSQRNTADHTGETSFGPSWECSWLSYIDYTWVREFDTELQEWQYWIDTPPELHESLGGTRFYVGDDTTPEYSTYSTMAETGNFHTACGYDFTISYPDGSRREYKASSCSGNFYVRKYLSAIVDPQGRRTVLNYVTNSGTLLLNSLVDIDNRTNLFVYDTIFTNQLSQVIDPFGRTNKFYYDGTGHLTNIVNAIGMGCKFVYDNQGVATNMITAYGTNAFKYSMNTNAGNVVTRSLLVTEPTGQNHLYIYRDQSTKLSTNSSVDLLPCSYSTNEVPSTSPFTNTLDNTWMDARNSFYWSPHSYVQLSTNYLQSGDLSNLTLNDYKLSRLRHWLMRGLSTLSTTLSMERGPSPDGVQDGLKQWYDYWGKSGLVATNCSGQSVTNYYSEGSGAAPRFIAYLLADGSSHFGYAEYNRLGHATNTVSTYSIPTGVGLRTNIFSYDANLIDLVGINGPSREMLATNTFNSWHAVLTNYDALGQCTTYLYNNSYQLIRTIGPTGLTVTNTYYTSGPYSNFLQTTKTLDTGAFKTFDYTNALIWTAANERGVTTTNTYDGLIRITAISDQRGTITSTYSNLDLIRIVDRIGYTNNLGYDLYGRRIWSADPLNHTNWQGYYAWGGLGYTTNALGQVTQMIYDNLGRTVVTLAPDLNGTTNQYNLLGQLLSTIDATGVSVTNYYNNQGLSSTASNAYGRASFSIFDARDRPTNTVDANGVTNLMAYDALNRVISKTYPADGSTESFVYDSHGLIAYTNQLGKATLNQYDSARRNISITNANSEVTQFVYDQSGNVTNMLDGKNHGTSWAYDQFGRMTNKTDATGTTIITNGFDANDRLTNFWTIAKGSIVYAYDAAGNLTNKICPLSPNIAFTYDSLNRTATMNDGVGTTYYTYTSFGTMLAEDGPWSNDTVTYSYKANHLLASLSLQAPNSSSWVQTYDYDNANRLRTLTAPEGVYVYSYSGAGALQQNLALPNGAYITNTYDSSERLKSTSLKSSVNALLNSHSYSYDLAGHPTNHIRTDGSYVNYAYDPIGQLVAGSGFESNGVVRPHETFGYSCDAADNLSIRTNNALIQTFSVDNLNRLTTVIRTGTLTVAGTTTCPTTNVTVNALGATLFADCTFAKDGFSVTNGNNTFTAVGKDTYGRADTNTITANLPATNSYSYDLNGNLLSDGLRGFDYDDENQLIRVTVTNAWKTELAYDGAMRCRVRYESAWNGTAWITNTIVRYIYDGLLVIQERDIYNMPKTTYTRGRDLSGGLQSAGGIGGLLARTDNSAFNSQLSACFYHCDRVGNITCMLNQSQQVAAKYLYDPYGNIISQSGPLADANRYRFASKESLLNSGLIYFGRRFYDSNLQRWINRDPIQETGGLNLYAYAANSPLAKIDFVGHNAHLQQWIGDPNLGSNWLGDMLREMNLAAMDGFQLAWSSDLGSQRLGALGQAIGNLGGFGGIGNSSGSTQTSQSSMGAAFRENLPGIIGPLIGGVADMLEGGLRAMSGMFTLNGSTLLHGLELMGRGLLGSSGVDESFFGEWTAHGPAPVNDIILENRGLHTEKDANNGYHEFHGRNNAMIVARYGPVFAPVQLLIGFYHEAFDFSSMQTEYYSYSNQRFLNVAYDSIGDLAANFLGTIGGLIVPRPNARDVGAALGGIVPGIGQPFGISGGP